MRSDLDDKTSIDIQIFRYDHIDITRNDARAKYHIFMKAQAACPLPFLHSAIVQVLKLPKGEDID